MGRGDKRTKRGKIAMGSFGKKRLAKRTARRKATAKKSIRNHHNDGFFLVVYLCP